MVDCSPWDRKESDTTERLHLAIAEFSKFAGIWSAALSQHHLSGFGIAQLEFHQHHLLGSEIAQLEFHHIQLTTFNFYEKLFYK